MNVRTMAYSLCSEIGRSNLERVCAALPNKRAAPIVDDSFFDAEFIADPVGFLQLLSIFKFRAVVGLHELYKAQHTLVGGSVIKEIVKSYGKLCPGTECSASMFATCPCSRRACRY